MAVAELTALVAEARRRPVHRRDDIPQADELRTLVHPHMLERGGFSYARRGFVAPALPLEDDVDAFAAAVEDFLAAYG